jgi:UPF0755 protein
MIKKLFLALIIVTTVTAAVGVYYYNQYQKFLTQAVFDNETVLTIEKGQNFRSFTQNILDKHANGKPWMWRLFAKMENVGGWLKVGEFNVSQDDTPIVMMENIKNNKVLTYYFTIVEGLNWRELRTKILSNDTLAHEVGDLSDQQLLDLLDSDKSTPEGLFLPETYQFVRGDSDIDLLKRAHRALMQGLEKQWQSRKENLPYKNSYELLTMASIVEKETSLASEREIVAGVFVRRLQKNMRLQTDPTVIYGLGESYDGDIRTKDLKTDTPYNTYTRKGLTPTPIAMASIESIVASAHPKEGKSLYFVANNRGGHYFSDTYEQHQRAVKDYLKGKKL